MPDAAAPTSAAPYLDIMRTVKVLRGLSDDLLETIARNNQIATYRAEDIVFAEGSCGRELYIVLQGEVSLLLDPSAFGMIERGATELRKVYTFKPGDSFGEIAVMDRQPRSGTAVAATEDTKLLILFPQMFDSLVTAQVIMNNVIRDVATKLRSGNTRLVGEMLSGYYLRALVEELRSGVIECDPLAPLEKIVVIRNEESFILSGRGRLLPEVPEKETLEIYLFSEPTILQGLMGEGEPSGEVILNTLFSIIRFGDIPPRINAAPFAFRVRPDTQRRAGELIVTKHGAKCPFTIAWEVKGARHNPETRVTHAYLNLYVYDEEAASTSSRTAQAIDNIDMPAQKLMQQTIAAAGVETATCRLLIVHHRTQEVARTLRTLIELGYQVDSFIGIPYGDINWDAITMLDAASGHNFLALRVLTHPTEPTRYCFDFRQSSFLDTQAEQDLWALYRNPAISSDYFLAMQALAEFRLEHALLLCRDRGQRLIIYEDGAYITGNIYKICKDAGHRLHHLVKNAVDDGTIAGVIEVTVAGERKNQQAIKENNGKAILPVLSNARSDIKAIFEAKGVGEAVLHAGATALGRLGLPTFQTRRIAVIGGNGAIGVRVVEQFSTAHNSTGSVYAVDIAEQPFAQGIDAAALPYAAIRLKHIPLPRYQVSEDCLPLTLHRCDPAAVATAVSKFLGANSPQRELALANGYPLEDAAVMELWRDISRVSGYQRGEDKIMAGITGRQFPIRKASQEKVITLLPAFTVFTFKSTARLIGAGIDTIVGVTGLPIFSVRDLDAFFMRRNPTPAVEDELVLISGSSKDYEFRQAIDVLNILLRVCANTPAAPDERLRWCQTLSRGKMSFLQEDDGALDALLAQPISSESVHQFMQEKPGHAALIGLDERNSQTWEIRLADFMGQRIRRGVAIRKELRPDIGSIYHLVVNGQPKRLVLLADGFVVNFYARHEKGVKTEYIDSIVTMQLLSIAKLSTTHERIPPGLYKMETLLRQEDMDILWRALDEKCRPLPRGGEF